MKAKGSGFHRVPSRKGYGMARTQQYVRHRVYVDALGCEMWIAEDADGRLHFPIKASCVELGGIDSDNALEAIKADSRLAPGLDTIRMPSAGGDQPTQCLHSTEYAWWLALLDPRRFRSLTEEQRQDFTRRQRILMQLAEEIMLKRTELKHLPVHRVVARSQAVTMTGPLSGDTLCPLCNGPLHITIDMVGWHVHGGEEQN
jgi:hypothetical protein